MAAGVGGRPRWRAAKMAVWGLIHHPLHGPRRAGSAASPRREAVAAAARGDAAPRRDAASPVLPRPLRLEAGAAPGGGRNRGSGLREGRRNHPPFMPKCLQRSNRGGLVSGGPALVPPTLLLQGGLPPRRPFLPGEQQLPAHLRAASTGRGQLHLQGGAEQDRPRAQGPASGSHWPGGYPHPTLHWREEGHDLENSSWVISSTSSSDTHVETLNSSHLSHHKVFKCVGSHVVNQEEPACTVEIKMPSLESEAPKTCFVGDDVTLTCRVTESTPAARITWLRDISRPEVEIQAGGRYLITQEGNVSRLTIRNCSQDTDGGCYVCKAQNPVGLRELFVCLTVTQPVNIVGVVAAVLVLSLVAVLTVVIVILYYDPLLCLRGAAFRNQDLGDVLVLVDSEDEDEGKGEEETMSGSTKHKAVALVNGSSVPAAYLNCLMEGDDGEEHSRVSPQERKEEDTRGT